MEIIDIMLGVVIVLVLFILGAGLFKNGINTEECKDLGYDTVIYSTGDLFSPDTCVKYGDYIKGTSKRDDCKMKLEVGKRSEDWCE